MIKAEEQLIDMVQKFLVSKHDIRLNLPRLTNLIDSKVNLKISSPPTSLMQQNQQNRYKAIIQVIQSLLGSNDIDIYGIDNFMEQFNRILNADIDIIQKNEVIRNNSFKIKEKLLFRIQQITKKTHSLNSNIEIIHDKHQVLNFVAIDLKNYLSAMKMISEEYDHVRTVQIHTSLKIDTIYQYQNTSEEDYYDHYEPLLEVLIRLRSNINNLHKAVKNSSKVQVPLRSVNLLANCKNLLIELEPFLISNNCAFNRLIFHVVNQQNQNLKLITGFYRSYIDFLKSLVYNVFKCVFLGHIFKSYYLQFEATIEQQKQKIMETILKINVNSRPEQFKFFEKQIENYERGLAVVVSRMREIKHMICFGSTSVMKLYLEEKICKKLNLLLKLKNKAFALQALLQQGKKYILKVKDLSEEAKTFLTKNKDEIAKCIKLLKSQGAQNRISSQKQRLKFEQNKKIQFEKNFKMIQSHLLKLHQIEDEVKAFDKNCIQQKIREEYFPKLYELTYGLIQEYTEQETNLLNCYMEVLQEKEQKEEQTLNYCSEVANQIQQYIQTQSKQEGQVHSAIGGQILNEDENCNKIKQFLQKIDKAEFMINIVKSDDKSRKKNSETQNQRLLAAYSKRFQDLRKFLEWLLVLFEGSMDENILQLVVDKMQYTEQSQQIARKNQAKVQQLVTQVAKYNRSLRNLIKEVQAVKLKIQQKNKEKQKQQYKQKQKNEEKQIQEQYSEFYSKMIKIGKERLHLYEIIENIYTQYMSIYIDLKITKNGVKPQFYDIESKGIVVFDKKLLKFCLLCYHSLNKTSVLTKQINDSNIAKRSKNYILDEICDPHNSRLQSYIKYQQSKMLELVLRLQKGIQIERDYKSKIKRWENVFQRLNINTKDLNEDKRRMKQTSKQITSIYQQLTKIIDLNKLQFVILNLEDVKKMQAQIEEYAQISKQVIELEDYSSICEGKTFKIEKLNTVVGQIQKIFVKT